MTRLRARLDRLLFAPSGGLAAALFRAMLAVMLGLVFWPAHDVVPLGVTDTLPGADRVYAAVFLTRGYWLAVVVGLVLLGAGVWPRAVGFALVATLAPLVPVLDRQQGRQVLILTLLAFSFLWSDARLSAAGRGGARARLGPGPRWPVLLIRLQLSLLYGVNAIAKTTGDFLSGDTLVGLARMLPNFPVDLSGGVLLVGAVAVPVWLVATGTVLTEYALAIGFWVPRLRWPAAILGILFHAAATQVVRIQYLDVVSVFLYAAFLLPFDRETKPTARE